jgi:hypothetical protein
LSSDFCSFCATISGRSGNVAGCAKASVGTKAIEARSRVRFIEILPYREIQKAKSPTSGRAVTREPVQMFTEGFAVFAAIC